MRKNARSWVACAFTSWPLRTWPRRLGVAAGVAIVIVAAWGVPQLMHKESGASDPPSVALTRPVRLCNEPLVDRCRAPSEIRGWMSSSSLEIIQVTSPRSGNQGAKVLTLRSRPSGEAPVVFRAKWRPASDNGLINDSRRELVAFSTQTLFLEPDEYVVPPTNGYCFPLEHWRRQVNAEAEASFADRDCVFGFLSFWLEGDFEVFAHIGDDEIRAVIEDPERLALQEYRARRVLQRKLARLNALAFAVAHGDAHSGQFLAATDPFRVFSVDHSVSLFAPKNPMIAFHEDWSQWLMPSVPRSLAERLRELTERDVERLAVLESYRPAGQRLVVVPEQPDLAPSTLGDLSFVERWQEGYFQVGTTKQERELIWAKLRELQRRIGTGDIPTEGL